MTTFNVQSTGDLQAILKYIESAVNDSLNAVGEKVKEKLQEYIQQNHYDVNSHDFYERTMQYLNSVDFKVTGKNSVDIYFDTSKISPSDGSHGMWPRHKSVSSGGDVSGLIPDFIEFGTSSPLYAHRGINSIEGSIAIAEQTNYHLQELVSQLAARGINATVV